jgi:hypothetical protein
LGRWDGTDGRYRNVFAGRGSVCRVVEAGEAFSPTGMPHWSNDSADWDADLYFRVLLSGNAVFGPLRSKRTHAKDTMREVASFEQFDLVDWR